MLDAYNVLATLFACSTHALAALLRGAVEMLGVGDAEWEERRAQLEGWVDRSCVLEARVEVFLLGCGRDGVVEWVRVLEGAVGMEESERAAWAECYGDAAGWVGRALGEMGWGMEV